MPEFDISQPFLDAAEHLRAVGKGMDTARTRAIGTLARRLPVQARRDIQQEYALKASRINAGLSVRREDDAVVLVGSKRGIGLIEFAGRWGGRKTEGAVARVRTDEGPHVYAGTFIATGMSGNRQIFDRSTRKRLPIKTLYGPSLANMLRDDERRERLGDFAQDIAARELDRLTRGRK